MDVSRNRNLFALTRLSCARLWYTETCLWICPLRSLILQVVPSCISSRYMSSPIHFVESLFQVEEHCCQVHRWIAALSRSLHNLVEPRNDLGGHHHCLSRSLARDSPRTGPLRSLEPLLTHLIRALPSCDNRLMVRHPFTLALPKKAG